MSRPALLAVAHGSREPAARDVNAALLDAVRALDPTLEVRLCHVELDEPLLPVALAELHGEAVVVPLLLSSGYHAAYDVRRVADGFGVACAPTLGPDPLLVDALVDRLAESGSPDAGAVVLAAAGSSDERAARDVETMARALSERIDRPVVAAYVSAVAPSVADAVHSLRESNPSGVAVATYLLAPGRLADAVAEQAADGVSAPLGAHRSVAQLVLQRYREAGQPA